jgi:hypothetical protein
VADEVEREAEASGGAFHGRGHTANDPFDALGAVAGLVPLPQDKRLGDRRGARRGGKGGEKGGRR